MRWCFSLMRAAISPNLTLAMMRPQLIDRAAELAAIVVERRRAMTGEMRIVLITGDQGLGKTRLVEHLLERHRRRLAILAARASPFSATRPFGV